MKDDKFYLIHIMESIDKIESYMAGLDFSAFMEKTIVQDAVLRNLRCSPNQPSVFPTISSLNILKSNGTRSPACEISWFITTWASILRRCGLSRQAGCLN